LVRLAAGGIGRGSLRGALTVRTTLFCVLLAASAAAHACGYCVEDKVAAVYDHAVVTRALADGHMVIFFAIGGTLRTKRVALESIAESVPGVDKGSARAAVELASLSVAFDPRRASLTTVQRHLDRKFAALGLSLAVLRTMDKPGELASGRR